MPYIAPERREMYRHYELMPPECGGDLNYVISRLISRYTDYHGLSYDVITQVRGALMGAMDEYNECVARGYEMSKREANGDVWDDLS